MRRMMRETRHRRWRRDSHGNVKQRRREGPRRIRSTAIPDTGRRRELQRRHSESRARPRTSTRSAADLSHPKRLPFRRRPDTGSPGLSSFTWCVMECRMPDKTPASSFREPALYHCFYLEGGVTMTAPRFCLIDSMMKV